MLYILKQEGYSVERKISEILTEKEINKLLNQIDISSAIGLRNKTLIKLALETGIKPFEIRELKWVNINFENKCLILKDRLLEISDETVELLTEWKDVQNQYVENIEHTFTTIQRLNKDNRGEIGYYTQPGKQLKANYLRAMLKRYKEKAGITRNISPMNLRHKFAVDFYRKNQNLKSLKQALGVTNLADVKIYKEAAEKQFQQSIEKLFDIYN